jgi:hypothetical protein
VEVFPSSSAPVSRSRIVDSDVRTVDTHFGMGLIKVEIRLAESRSEKITCNPSGRGINKFFM